MFVSDRLGYAEGMYAVLPVPPATDRGCWDLRDGAADLAALRRIVRLAEADLDVPWPMPLASTAALVHRTGDRNTHEQLVFARSRRLTRAAVAAAATLDSRFLDAAADGAWLLCEQSSWCWPAHDDARSRRGFVLPDVRRPFLDLGAGEVAAQLAWLDHLLGDCPESGGGRPPQPSPHHDGRPNVLGNCFDERYPGLRQRIRLEIRERVLVPFVERRDWHWLGRPGDVHNWNPWIHHNVLVAALGVLDSPGDAELRDRVVELVVSGLDVYLGDLPADGAVDEGFHYWWEGACRALEALDLLAFAAETSALSLPAQVADERWAMPSVRATVGFPLAMLLGDGWCVNVADGPARVPDGLPWDVVHRAALRIGDLQAAAEAASLRRPDQPVTSERAGLGRLLRAITDRAWVESVPTTSPSESSWFESVQLLVVRSSGQWLPAGPGRPDAILAARPCIESPWAGGCGVASPNRRSATGLALVVKGGHNGEHHNHLDVGEVIVACDGVPVLVDPGRPTYTADTFGARRYDLWVMQSAWHNVPLVRGREQEVGPAYRAEVVGLDLWDKVAASCPQPLADGPFGDLAEHLSHSGLALELAAAYPVAGLRSWRREAVLVDGRVIVRDAWALEPWSGPDPEPPTVLHFVIAGTVTLGVGTARIVPVEGSRTVRVGWPSEVQATLTTRTLDDPMLSNVWGDRLTRLELDVSGRAEIAVTVAIEEES